MSEVQPENSLSVSLNFDDNPYGISSQTFIIGFVVWLAYLFVLGFLPSVMGSDDAGKPTKDRPATSAEPYNAANSNPLHYRRLHQKTYLLSGLFGFGFFWPVLVLAAFVRVGSSRDWQRKYRPPHRVLAPF
jgi:hypothetical protein